MPWSSVYGRGNAQAKVFIPATPWVPAGQVKRLRAVFELISAQSGINVIFAYQTCNVENAPGTAVEVGSALTADGMSYGTLTDVSSNTGSKQLVRFGYSVWSQSGSQVIGRCGGYVEYDDC